MAYFFLLAIQLFGAIFFICHQLPEFRQVVNNPGVQLSSIRCLFRSFDAFGVSSCNANRILVPRCINVSNPVSTSQLISQLHPSM